MVHLYIGDGKGKTTAALGLALRACGWDKRIYIGQFLKDYRLSLGETKAIEKYKLKIKIERFKDQIHPMFVKEKELDRKKIKRSVERALAKIESYITAEKFDLIILDEVLSALKEGFVSKERLKRIINKAKDTELILTGRYAPPELIKLADYVSAMKKIKHPFGKNIFARVGIEY